MLFKKNINQTGRLVRLILSLMLLIYAVWQQSWVAFALFAFTLFEALFSWCIFYQMMGWNSCPVRNPPKDKSQKR